ncbi:sperm-associated antigen 8-like [Rana temporaria]|uniref:sperm-associated antigen 8-like n=1 Tax=Rana temporaria TaxID=8407 RepID=UPI001AAD49DE|nr:sperm-associated antigen 8-like [Rana temporaria]XP_040190529.1 sperm-associated antigen 8-like [Rana temporaria]
MSGSLSQEVGETLTVEEIGEMESTTQRDFLVDGFVPQTPLPTKSRDYWTDPAVTFWTENLRGVTGVSDVRSRDTPFKKSSAFSTPISQNLDQPVPYSLENYPNM